MVTALDVKRPLELSLSRWLSDKESTGVAGDTGLFPGSGRSPEEEMATHSSVLAWNITWTESPGELSPWGYKRVVRD